jgi:hypothetical protein
MTGLPGTRTLRQRFAFLFLAVGAVLLARAAARDWPHEQRLIFHLEGELARTPLRLDTSVTRVGEGEARAGMTLERDGSERTNPTQTLRVPNGEYVVTVAWEPKQNAVLNALGEPKEVETSSVHRVTLEGGEVVVRVRSRVSE